VRTSNLTNNKLDVSKSKIYLTVNELRFRSVGYEAMINQIHSFVLCLPRVLVIRRLLYITLFQHIPFSTNRLKLMKRALQREVITKVRMATAKRGHQLIFSSRSYHRELSRSNRAAPNPRRAATNHPSSLHKWRLNKGISGRTTTRSTLQKRSVKPLITAIS
jgi:hypothetical protein